MMRGWLRLLRIPNLLTVPGDPLAGYLLAAGAGAVWGRPLLLVMATALLFYMAGLIMNDVADARVDARERPQRPIPSGAVDETIARLVAVSLITLALLFSRYLGLATTGVAFALLLCIGLYNQFLKPGSLGPLCMGLCRGLSLMLGASLADLHHPLAWIAAGGLTLYIMAVTLVARGEMSATRPLALNLLPVLATLAVSTMLLQLTPVSGQNLARLALSLFLLLAMTGLVAWRLSAGAAAPPLVGMLISATLFLQAAFCIASAASPLSLAAGLVLLLAWPLNRALARFVAAS